MDSKHTAHRAEVLDTYGYKFRPGKDHLTPEQLAPLRFKYDVVGSEAMEAIDEISPPPPPRAGWYAKTKAEDATPERDTYALVRDNVDRDPRIKALWDEVTTIPDWVDWEQIKRGQDVFWRYALANVSGFAFMGLVGATGSSYRPAETLARTGGHSVKVAKRRLFETFQYLLQVTKDLEAVKPGGVGFVAGIRVRLLHASVRNRILKLQAQRPTYFDFEKYGYPISDVDSMQALLAFSGNLLWLALPTQGIHVRPQEILEYLALWRWLGLVVGAPYDILERPEKARATMESLLFEARKPTENSRIIAKNLLSALDGVDPLYVPKDFFEAGTRYINGDAICDDIGIGKPSLYWRAVVAGQIWTLQFVSYAARSIAPWDRWQIKTFRKLFWDYVVLSKDGLNGGYQYDMQYVPQLEATTRSETRQGPVITGGLLEKFGIFSFLFWITLFTVLGGFAIVSLAKVANVVDPRLAIAFVGLKG